MLLNVTPFSYGIESVGGVMEILIPRNSIIPIKKTKIFTNYSENQRSAKIKVYEGERQLTKDNHLLGKFKLDGIPPMKRGKAQIEVTFNLDVNSILSVTAVEKSSGKNNKLVIINDKGEFSKDDNDDFEKEEKEEIEKKIEEK